MSDLPLPEPSLPSQLSAPGTLPAPTLPDPVVATPALAAPSIPVLPAAVSAAPLAAPIVPAPFLAAPVLAAPIPAVMADGVTALDEGSAQAGAAHVSAAEMFAAPQSEVHPADLSVEDQRPLIRTRWLRIAVIVGQVFATVVAFGLSETAPGAATLVGIVPALALIAWTWCAVTNAVRARPATRHHSPPRPMWAALSWLLAPALALPGFALVLWVKDWVDAGSYDQQGTRAMAYAAVVLLVVAVMLWAIYRPYSVLGQASRWASGDGDKFRRWFLGPIFVLALCAVGLLLATLMLVAGEADGDTDAGGVLAVGGAVAGVFLLPWVTWLILGSRAMIDMEEAIAHQHRRRSTEAEAVAPMNPLMAAQSAAMADHAT